MYTQIISVTKGSITIPVPKEYQGHTVEVLVKDLGTNGEGSPGARVFQSIEEVHEHFRAVKIDTRGWKFDREEANRRR